MDRDLLAHLPVVVAVAREKGFAAAASALSMSASAVSHAVKAVEDKLGEPLFARTTRSSFVASTRARACSRSSRRARRSGRPDAGERVVRVLGAPVRTGDWARGAVTKRRRVRCRRVSRDGMMLR